MLKASGHDVSLIALITPKSKMLTDRLDASEIPFSSLGMKKPWQLPIALIRLTRLLKARQPDLVHGHMVHANILTRLAKVTMPSLRLINTAHSIHEGGPIRDWAYRITNGFSDLDTTISEAAMNRFLTDRVFRPQKSITVSNGIDTKKYHKRIFSSEADRDEFQWLAVGRLDDQKDYPTLLQAFSSLQRSVLLVAGVGPLLKPLQNQVKELGLGERVEFLGLRTDLESLYSRVDGFVLSSKYEGYGLVVAEAMASELPVVVTNSGGPNEIVGLGSVNGIVVPTQNPEKLAGAMLEVERMSLDQRNRMGSNARRRIESIYSLKAISKQWEAIYASLVD